MHINVSIAWWCFPIAALVGGFLSSVFLVPPQQGSYDFMPGLVTVMWLGSGMVLALGLLIGHFIG